MSPDYQIHELAEKAGVSVRTVRFYIDEGLLPAPQVHGRYSVYSDEYLARLELIRLLKDRYLPLREIRSLLQSASNENVLDLLKQEREQVTGDNLQKIKDAQEPESGTNSSALEYVNRVLKRQPTSRPRLEETTKNYFFNGVQAGISSPYPDSSTGETESWSRIRLAPGVELHIQQPIEKSIRKKLFQLIEFARKLFNL